MENASLQEKAGLAHSLRTLVRMALAAVLLGGASAQAAERADGDAILINNGWIGTQKTLIWRGVRVADLEDFSCLIWGGYVYNETRVTMDAQGKFVNLRLPAGEGVGFVTSRSETEAVVQFRYFRASTGTMWGVKVAFTQGDDGVYAQAIWARYKGSGVTSVENDLETSYEQNITVATSSTSNGYGAYQVTARCRSRQLPPGPIVCPATHRFIGPEPVLLWKNVKWSDLPGQLGLDTNLNAWMGGGWMGAVNPKAYVMTNVDAKKSVQFRHYRDSDRHIWGVLLYFFKNGDCIYGQGCWGRYQDNVADGYDHSLESDAKLAGTAASGFTAAGYGVYQLTLPAINGQHSPFFTGVCGAWLTSTDRIVWRNVSLARVRNVRGITGGTSTYQVPVCERHRTFTAGANGNPDTLEVQMNYEAKGTVRCTIVLFTQQGTDVVGRIKAAKYTSGTVDFDFSQGGSTMTIAEDIDKAGYGISRLQADIAPEDGAPAQQTDADGNRFVLAGTADSVTDLSLAGTLTVNGAGPFALNGVNNIGVLAVEGFSSVSTKINDYWFKTGRTDLIPYYNVSEFVVGGNGVNTIGQLAWRDVTQLDKIDASATGWQHLCWDVGLTLSGANTVAAPFIPPSYAFFRIKSGRTSLPFLAPSTAELGNGSLFAVDAGATLAIGGYDHQSDYPVHFAVQGTLDVADTLTLDGGASLTGTGIVTAKAVDSMASSNTLGGVTFVPPAEGCTLSGSVTVTSAGLTFGEGRTVLAANANLTGGKVKVLGTLAVPAAATVKSLDLAGGTLEIGENTLLPVTDPLTTIATVRVASADRSCSAWRTPRPFLRGANLTAKTVSRIVNTMGSEFAWDVTVTDEGGTKVCSLSRRAGLVVIIR